MDEWQKMVAGELYNALDPALVAARERCRASARHSTRQPNRAGKAPARFSDLLEDAAATPRGCTAVLLRLRVNIELGERVYFNSTAWCSTSCKVSIGDFTFFGPAVQVYTASHPLDPALRRTQEFGKPVSIGDDVWIGGGSIILPGVTIGSRSVIGAGSVVTRNVPSDVLAAGNPCRVIRALT